MLETLFTTQAWASPGGVGFFLICLGTFIYLLGHADQKKTTKK